MSQRRFLVCAEWFNEWISFLYGEKVMCPHRIDNTELATMIINDGIQSLVRNVDYHEFPLPTWKSLLSIYRGGPAI